MELEHIKNSILDIRGFASLCTFAKASDKASRKQERKSSLTLNWLNYMRLKHEN
jgi:hypothetical protein